MAGGPSGIRTLDLRIKRKQVGAFRELWDEVRILGIVGRWAARRPHSFSHELMGWRVRAGAWGAEAIVRRPVVSQNSIPI